MSYETVFHALYFIVGGSSIQWMAAISNNNYIKLQYTPPIPYQSTLTYYLLTFLTLETFRVYMQLF